MALRAAAPHFSIPGVPFMGGCILAGMLAFGACSPSGGYDARAVVLENGGEPVPGLRAGELLGAGTRVHPEAGSVTLRLLPGAVATLGAGGTLTLDRLRLFKRGARMLGREADLTLSAGELDLLIAAPEEAAPTTIRLRTPAGEIVAGPGCLARIQVEGSTVHALAARGEPRVAGEPLPAGQAGTFPALIAPHPAAADAVEQIRLATLLEQSARMQTIDLQTQALPPGWRFVAH